ncbi:hypothetical protein ASD06_07485 [Angustibacter sp. Root456]|nr:hypothetical protein ASD06_07485 [Angustibacter sp. Root456]
MATTVLAAAAVVLLVAGFRSSGGPPQPAHRTETVAPATSSAAPSSTPSAPASSSGTAGGSVAPAADFGPVLDRSRPVRLRLPSLGVDVTPLVDLALDSRGQLAAPSRFDQVGWYADGPAPGELGPAVLAGHVDSKAGPAVFFKLGALKRGDAVLVTRADGLVARFVVDEVGRYPKARFPTERVYGTARHRAELRLITCGGAFNHRTGHYLDNIVVYAHLVGST